MIGQLDSLLEQLDALQARAIEQLEPISTSAELEEWDNRYLGRKRGELTNISSVMGKLSKEERPVVGQRINAVKAELTQRLAAKREALRQRELLQALEQERIDVTLPGREMPVGHMHPISRTIWDVTQVFVKMGFHVEEGPEVETDYYNFQALNIPADHPARDMQDTFWVVPGQILLRTQTSPMQIRVMQQTRPPVRVVVPGKVYRNEAIDASHEAMFPSAEMDIDCPICNGQGCRTCKYSGWVEMLGSGMVHPRVLREVGYDPEKYRGFAFGMGVERIAILKYSIGEIRLFSGNDLRFLRQF